MRRTLAAAACVVLTACAGDGQRTAPAPTRDSTPAAAKEPTMATIPPDAAAPATAPLDAAAPAIAEAEWTRAEAVLRAHLDAERLATTEIRRSRRVVTAFAVVRASDGVAVDALVAGDRAWVGPQTSQAAVTAYLRGVDWLARRDAPPEDVLYLLRTFGTVPEEIAKMVGRPRGELRGYPTTVEDRKGGGVAIVQHYPRVRQGRPPGAVAGPRKLPAYRAVLAISPAYELAWKVEEVEVADLEPTR